MSKGAIIGVIIVVLIVAGVSGFILFKHHGGSIQNEGVSQQEAPQGGANSPSEGKSLYTGFMKMNPGAWSEVVAKMSNSGKEAHRRVVYVGEEKVEGKDAQGMELSIAHGAQNIIAQIWLEKGTYKPLKYVTKMGDQVFCITQSQMEAYLPKDYEPSLETPEEYNPEKPDISYGTYTTPTGKTVHVAKFKGKEGGEVWVSSEVPFGFVKVMDKSGETDIALWDFGLSGGKIQITKDDLKNCVSLPQVPNIPNLPLP